MQSRLEEEEEAKAALMSRIQKLTKLILVSTKNSIPGYLGDTPTHQRSISAGKEDVSLLFKSDYHYVLMFLFLLLYVGTSQDFLYQNDSFCFLFALQKLDSLLVDSDNLASPSSTLSVASDASLGLKQRRSSSKLKDENSPVGSGAELTQVSLGFLAYICLHRILFIRSLVYPSSQNQLVISKGCLMIQGCMHRFSLSFNP